MEQLLFLLLFPFKAPYPDLMEDKYRRQHYVLVLKVLLFVFHLLLLL